MSPDVVCEEDVFSVLIVPQFNFIQIASGIAMKHSKIEHVFNIN